MKIAIDYRKPFATCTLIAFTLLGSLATSEAAIETSTRRQVRDSSSRQQVDTDKAVSVLEARANEHGQKSSAIGSVKTVSPSTVPRWVLSPSTGVRSVRVGEAHNFTVGVSLPGLALSKTRQDAEKPLDYDDETAPGMRMGDQADADEAQANITKRRAEFRSTLSHPLSTAPVQEAMTYVDDDGKQIPSFEEQRDYLADFAGYYHSPFYVGGPRLDMNGCGWYPKSTVWKSPDICYQPLYFEEANLERFGARYPLIQPGLSAVHFFSNTVLLPYSMGLQSPCRCYYSAGYGRPGNRYCYQMKRPVWSLKGATFQALLVTGIVFALP